MNDARPIDGSARTHEGAAGTARGAAPRGRAGWLDIARGLSMALVVVLHAEYAMAAIGDRAMAVHLFSLALMPLRLPLFFLVAGLLAAGVMARGAREVLRRRVAHYGYLFVVWCALYEAFHLWLLPGLGPPGLARLYAGPDRLPWVLASANGHQWFIYALALFFALALALRPLPVAAQAAIAVAVGLVGTAEPGGALGPTVLDHFHYFPWFLLGLLGRDRLIAAAPRLARPGALAAIGLAWAAATALAHKARLLQDDLVRPALSLLALPFGIGLSAWLAGRHPLWGAPLRLVGRNTLHVYVLHTMALRLVLASAERPASVPREVWAVAVAALAIVMCLAAGRVLARVPGLFAIPGRQRAPRPAPAA